MKKNLPAGQPAADLSLPLADAARQLDLSIESAQAIQLITYLRCLERWNRVHNLSAQGSLVDFMVQHVFDSMTLVGPLTRFAKGRPLRVLDAGTGAGFPAVVLAVLRPDWTIAAVDAVAKKVAFVRQAAMESGIANLVAWHSRLESLHPEALFDVVVSRAFSSLDRLIDSTGHLLSPSGVWVAMKGRMPTAEMSGLNRTVGPFHVERVTVPGARVERNLVWMRRIST